jgi:GTPase Era involved in 16S rRNA processing
MRKLLLERTKIGEFLSIEAYVNTEDIDLILYSVDVASNCVFKKDEWQEFVKNVNKIDRTFKTLSKKND